MTTATATPISIPSYALFSVDEESVANNHGHLGECTARCTVIPHLGSPEREFELSMTLQADNPDSSDDDARAEHTLTASLLVDGVQIVSYVMDDYEYHGDNPGDHLCEILEVCDEFYESLAQAVADGKATLAPGYTFD